MSSIQKLENDLRITEKLIDNILEMEIFQIYKSLLKKANDLKRNIKKRKWIYK